MIATVALAGCGGETSKKVDKAENTPIEQPVSEPTSTVSPEVTNTSPDTESYEKVFDETSKCVNNAQTLGETNDCLAQREEELGQLNETP